MAKKALSIEIYTTGHRILGRLQPGGMGMFSFINDPTKSYIEVQDAFMNRLHQPGELVARYKQLWLVKREIMAVLLSGRSEIGPTGAARRGYASTISYRVHISLGGYELIGVIETAGKFEFGGVMFESDRQFSALYDAMIVATLSPRVTAKSPAVLFNRERVESMAAFSSRNGEISGSALQSRKSGVDGLAAERGIVLNRPLRFNLWMMANHTESKAPRCRRF